jgi:hypothetical protein
MMAKLYGFIKRFMRSDGETTTKKKKAAVAKKYTPKPRASDRWVKVPKDRENFAVIIPDDIYMQLVDHMLDGGHSEVEGSFNIAGDGQFTAITLHKVGTSGAVSMEAEEAAEAHAKDSEKHGHMNGQWHSHGTMSAFWSGTDDRDQEHAVDSVKMIVNLTKKPANLHFMCVGYSGLECKVRRITVYPDDKIEYEDTYAKKSNGKELRLERTYTSVTVTPSYQYYDTGWWERYRNGDAAWDDPNAWEQTSRGVYAPVGDVVFPDRKELATNRRKLMERNGNELTSVEHARLVTYTGLSYQQRMALAELYEIMTWEVEDLVTEWLEDGIEEKDIYDHAALALAENRKRGR